MATCDNPGSAAASGTGKTPTKFALDKALTDGTHKLTPGQLDVVGDSKFSKIVLGESQTIVVNGADDLTPTSSRIIVERDVNGTIPLTILEGALTEGTIAYVYHRSHASGSFTGILQLVGANATVELNIDEVAIIQKVNATEWEPVLSVPQAGLGTTGTPIFTSLQLNGFTVGSVPFVGTGKALNEDNENLSWDNTNKILSTNELNLTTVLDETYGGTGQSSVTLGDLLYGSAANTWSKLAGNTTTTKQFLSQTGDGANSAAPAWAALTASDVPTSDLSGTTNQVNLSASGTGVLVGGTNITLSLPQNIHTGSSPTFTGLTLSGLTEGQVVFPGSGGVLSGSSNLFWDATKGLGVGTNSPIVRSGFTAPWLTISSPAVGIALRESDATNPNTAFMSLNGGSLRFGKMDDDGTNITDYMALTLSNGSFGVGSTSPNSQFQSSVNVSSYPTTGVYGQIEATGAGAFTTERLSLGFNTTTNKGFIQALINASAFHDLLLNPSGGNIGVGTTSPNAKLHVEGSAIFNENGADVDFRIEGDTEQNLFFVDASTDRIGIGTSSPSAKLHVEGATDAAVLVKNTGSAVPLFETDCTGSGTGGELGRLSWKWAGNEVARISAFIGDDGTNKDEGDIVFSTANGGILGERFRIHQEGRAEFTGNVGIGVVPQAKLHAGGAGTVPSLATGTTVIIQNNSGTTDQCRISILGGNAGWSILDFSDADDTDVGQVAYNHTDNYMRFRINGASKMYLDSTGMGIGIDTPNLDIHLKSTAPGIEFEPSAGGNHGSIKQTGNVIAIRDETGGTDLAIFRTTTEVEFPATVAVGGTGESGQLFVEQPSSSGDVPVLTIKQADIDDVFIDFRGTSAANTTRSISTLGAGSAITDNWTFDGMVRVEINGTQKWMPFYVPAV